MAIYGWEIALATLVLVVLAWKMAKRDRGSDSFAVVMLRLACSHVKLAAELAIGFVAAFIAAYFILDAASNRPPPRTPGSHLGAWTEAERLARFGNMVTAPPSNGR